MLEHRLRPWSSGGALSASPLSLHLSDALSRAMPPVGGAPIAQKPNGPSSLGEGKVPQSLPCRATSEERHALMRMPPFLQPLAGCRRPNRGGPCPAAPKARKGATQEEGQRKGGAALPLLPAPSTASTVTAESSTKASDGPGTEATSGEREVSPDIRIIQEAHPTSVPPSRRPTTEKQGEPLAPLVSETSPANSKELGVFPAVAKSAAASEESALVTKHERMSSNSCGPMKPPNSPVGEALLSPASASEKRAGAAGGKQELEGNSSGLPYDPQVARLAAALAASSLRLAAAAEEGLDSSPSNFGGRPWLLERGPRVPTPEYSTAEFLLTESPPTPQTTSSRTHRQAMGRPPFRRGFLVPKSPAVGKGQVFLQSPPQGSPSKHVSTRRCHTEGRKEKTAGGNRKRQSGECSIPQESRLARLNEQPCRAALLPIGEPQSCCNTSSPRAVGSTWSSSSGSSKSRQKGCSMPLNTANSPPSRVALVSSSAQALGEVLDLPIRSAEGPPLLQKQGRDGTAHSGSTSSLAPAAEEEEQFCLLLQHSLGMLRREAARCFASSQASVKQKLWGQLQQERLLRLHEQEEHQNAAATAAAELASLRARSIEDYSRTRKLLHICCRRQETEDASKLVITAWRGWQVQRLLRRRCIQIQHVVQKRRLFLLLLRTFSPWRAAAARRVAAQRQQTAQRLLQQEVQRLEQVHLDGRQQQEQQLLRLQQQLAGEARLRECLQRSLVGIFAGEGLGVPLQGNPKPSPSAGAPPSGILKGKRQQPRRLREQLLLQQKPLAVVGMHSTLRERGNAAHQPQLQQRQHQKLRQHGVIQRASYWQGPLQERSIGAMDFSMAGTSAPTPGTANDKLGAPGRRVKFMDDELQQQQQQQEQLMLLASLLATSPSSRQLDGSSQMPGYLWWASRDSYREENRSGLVSSSSAPEVACWGLFSKEQGRACAAEATEARQLAASDQPLQPHTCLLQGRSVADGNPDYEGAVERPWGVRASCSVGLHGQAHKEQRWTHAAHFSPPA